MTIQSNFKSVSHCVNYYRFFSVLAVFGIVLLAFFANALPFMVYDFYAQMYAEPFGLVIICLFLLYMAYADERHDNVNYYQRVKVYSQTDNPEKYSRVESLQRYVNDQRKVLGIRRAVEVCVLDLPEGAMELLIAQRNSNYQLFVSESVLMRDASTLRAVVMHELAHAKHKDLLLIKLATWTIRFSVAALSYGLYLGLLDQTWSLLLMLPVYALVVALQVFLFTVYSRLGEFAADVFAVKNSAYGMFLVTFLRYLEALYDDDADNIEDYDDLSDIPLSSDRSLFDTHPLTENRIKLIEKMIPLKLKSKAVNI